MVNCSVLQYVELQKTGSNDFQRNEHEFIMLLFAVYEEILHGIWTFMIMAVMKRPTRNNMSWQRIVYEQWIVQDS